LSVSLSLNPFIFVSVNNIYASSLATEIISALCKIWGCHIGEDSVEVFRLCAA